MKAKLLRWPAEAPSHQNYEVCGTEARTTSKPCQNRALTHLEGYCKSHAPQNVKARLDKRESKLRAQQEAAEARNWKVAGKPIRGDIGSSKSVPLLSKLTTVINLQTSKFATSDAEKRAMLRGCPGETKFLVVWQGDWRNDAFITDAQELQRLLTE